MHDQIEPGWAIGPVSIVIAEAGRRDIAGWINGLWGIDWRGSEQDSAVAWIVTHMPSGFSMAAFRQPLREVMILVDEIAEMIDWNADYAACLDRLKKEDKLAGLGALVRLSGGTSPRNFPPPTPEWRLEGEDA